MSAPSGGILVTADFKLDVARDVSAVLADTSQLDDEVFDALYRYYKPSLVRFAARQRASDPEGVADSALFDAYRAFERLEHRTESAFRSYLYRAARSHAIGEHRRGLPIPAEFADDDLVEESLIDELVEADWLRSLVEELPPDQRAVIESNFFRDMTAVATARNLNKSPNAVYQLQHRALRRLRATILAGATVVALVLTLWALRQQDGTHGLVDQSPVDRSSVSTPRRPAGLVDGVKVESPEMHVTTTSSTRGRSTAAPESSGAARPTTSTSFELGGTFRPGATSTPGTTKPTSGQALTTSNQPASTTLDTPVPVPPTTTDSSTFPPISTTAPTGTYAQTCKGKPATIVGRGLIYGTDGPDVIVASGGKDVIHGLGGDDTICGRNGKDQLFGGDGDDVLVGGQGKDLLDGGTGTNILIEDGS